MPFKACMSVCWWRVLRHEHTYQTPGILSITSAATHSPLSNTTAATQSPLFTTTAATQCPYVEPTNLCCCFAGLITAYVSDTSLHDFVTANKERQAAGQPKQQLLQTGEHPSMLFFCTRKAARAFLYSSQTQQMSSGKKSVKVACSFGGAPATLMCL